MLRVYNTLSRSKEAFEPRVGNRVDMFVCGPTVYDRSHLGHARTYVAFDTIAKYLRYKGYAVFYLMNVTDIDDKMISRARERGISVKDLADEMFALFLEDMDRLGCDAVNLYAKATEHIPEIVAQIRTLEEKGIAYNVYGDVYFMVVRHEGFGKLSGQRLEELRAGARLEVDEKKRDPADFVLWKAHREGEPKWESPWGPGRPGWHVEDTAITTHYFGAQYDLHGGAMDLIFPHHEAEIAIAECATGKAPFVKYWCHTGFLNVEGRKMSKSLGNFLTIRDTLERYPPEVVRFFLLFGHYRSPIDFTEGALAEAEKAYGKLTAAKSRLEALARTAGQQAGDDHTAPGDASGLAADANRRIEAAMDDDFNTREALAAMFDYAAEVQRLDSGRLSASAIAALLEPFERWGRVLGLFRGQKGGNDLAGRLVEVLLDTRERARKAKDWATADRIREELGRLGVEIEDGAEGPRWRLLR